MPKKIIKICTGGACSQNLSAYLLERAKNDRTFYKLENLIEIQECPCQGNCSHGPTVIVENEDGSQKRQYSRVDPLEMGKIIQRITGRAPEKKPRKKPRT